MACDVIICIIRIIVSNIMSKYNNTVSVTVIITTQQSRSSIVTFGHFICIPGCYCLTSQFDVILEYPEHHDLEVIHRIQIFIVLRPFSFIKIHKNPLQLFLIDISNISLEITYINQQTNHCKNITSSETILNNSVSTINSSSGSNKNSNHKVPMCMDYVCKLCFYLCSK